MAEESLLFSFAKFLELKFYSQSSKTRYQGNQASTCEHSLHQDYVQYFLHKDKLAAFQYVLNIATVYILSRIEVYTLPMYVIIIVYC